MRSISFKFYLFLSLGDYKALVTISYIVSCHLRYHGRHLHQPYRRHRHFYRQLRRDPRHHRRRRRHLNLVNI